MQYFGQIGLANSADVVLVEEQCDQALLFAIPFASFRQNTIRFGLLSEF